MATKAKKKPAKAAKATKPKPKKKPPRKRKPAGPPFLVENHPFAPGTKVSFLRTFEITVERNLNREPIPKPVATATVAKDGSLEVRGLDKKTHWCAAGPVGDRFLYLQFSVK